MNPDLNAYTEAFFDDALDAARMADAPLLLAGDAFGRSVATGWGSADLGGEWDLRVKEVCDRLAHSTDELRAGRIVRSRQQHDPQLIRAVVAGASCGDEMSWLRCIHPLCGFCGLHVEGPELSADRHAELPTSRTVMRWVARVSAT